MDGPGSDVVVSTPIGSNEGGTTVPVGGPTQEAHQNGQAEQCSGVLIKLFSVPMGAQSSSTSIVFCENGTEEERLRTPSICWICHRLTACLSKALDRRHTTFILGSSSSNCALNHKLLNATRFFLKKSGIIPDRITVYSGGPGPLRLVLETRRPGVDEAMPARLALSGIQNPEMTVLRTETSDDPHTMYMRKSYDMYQDLQETATSVPQTWIPNAAHILKNSYSNECLSLAKTWFDDCLREHPQCRKKTTHFLPHRVIDVKGDRLRLFTPRRDAMGHWIALSHCWGSTNTFKTTLETLESHHLGIEWEELPKTFKDAVTVARALEVDYLWIDSLCIIQDDGGADFHAEAAKMCDIYRNSILTIAASCSASDSAGFLQERIVDDPVELTQPRGMESIRFRPSIDHTRTHGDDPIHSRAWTFQETILPRRLLSFGSRELTWECETLRQCECLQIEYEHQAEKSTREPGRAAYREYARAIIEKRFHLGKNFVLPRSILSYELERPIAKKLESYAARLLDDAPSTGNQKADHRFIDSVYGKLIIEASKLMRFSSMWVEKRYSEKDDPHEVLASYHRYGWSAPHAFMEWAQNLCHNILAIKGFYRYWRRVLVPEYTRRALSKDSDRLIALQAIASNVHQGINDRYLAGLWKGDLVNQLCWQSADDRALPADNDSPSWSWSSVHGPVTPFLAEEFENSRSDQTKIKVIEAKCSPVGRNPCGRVIGGSIIVETSAIGVRYVKNMESGLFEFHPIISRKGQPQWKEVKAVPLKLDLSSDTPLGCQPDGSLSRSTERDSLDTSHRDREMSAIFLVVRLTKNFERCVLVCGRRSADSNAYRRLGIGLLKTMFLTPYLFDGRFVLI